MDRLRVYTSPKTGSTWTALFNSDYELIYCWLDTKEGKSSKLIVNKALDTLIFNFFILNDLL